MSPIQAMERSYATLKQVLREGRYAPGTRLEANRLAEALGVSMTPVRDVLHRLVGEGLVESSAGEGFHVPRFSEAALRDLYEWHSTLVLMAVRTARQPLATDEFDDDTVAGRTAQLFERIGAMAPNREIRSAIAGAGDRLHPYRLVEPQILEPLIGELDALAEIDAGLPQAIRRYHLRRMKVVSDLIRQRDAA
ncbi:GntR family transcriptional regulator [Sphingomonas sp. G-3-2-10]|jgi:DNA-binding GntR family transcriptional regulator|uniref:GntR family transcriptional regulator n=1 Tax=Sphingomonas sp. G-3-2-10 TaxID=2728838 RepID=UPI00146C58A2|nr:GntR family transcriptional regulator [Sphingomonas sp. G-3-2-10]NML08061.1 GntR family transcriptional regulator [Sphingomonas sp. G-3-2-10]